MSAAAVFSRTARCECCIRDLPVVCFANPASTLCLDCQAEARSDALAMYAEPLDGERLRDAADTLRLQAKDGAL